MKCCKAAELLSEDFFGSRMPPWNYQESKQDFVNIFHLLLSTSSILPEWPWLVRSKLLASLPTRVKLTSVSDLSLDLFLLQVLAFLCLYLHQISDGCDDNEDNKGGVVTLVNIKENDGEESDGAACYPTSWPWCGLVSLPLLSGWGRWCWQSCRWWRWCSQHLPHPGTVLMFLGRWMSDNL